MFRVLKPGGRAWIFELRRETAAGELRQFARAEGLPFLMVYLGFKVVSWHHSLTTDGVRRQPPGGGRLPVGFAAGASPPVAGRTAPALKRHPPGQAEPRGTPLPNFLPP